jgi:predicted alpha/beta-fold hydrolase
MSIHGHFWTIAPHIQRRLLLSDLAPAKKWSCVVPDARYGSVRVHGKLSAPRALNAVPVKAELLIVIHGLGGSSESGYTRYAANVANAAGLSCLRLNQRGADLQGEDYYHAGLWQDLDAVLTDPEVARFDAIYLLGYSMGGQLCLHWAARAKHDASRVCAVASVCAPLDLSRTAANLDSFANSVYRAHVLAGLRKAYAAVAARREVPVPVSVARCISRIREWDDRITAPRHGFANAEHYYAEASAGPCLPSITTPTLMVVAEADPMVPMSTMSPALRNVAPCIVVKRLARGGHVGFPSRISLGQSGSAGLEQQIVTWLKSARGRPGSTD